MRTLTLIAHDGKKADMVAWATFNRQALAGYQLVVTASTARLLCEKVGLEVEAVQPGRRLSDWPADVAALANALGLQQFSVLGYSGGGPYTAVCAEGHAWGDAGHRAVGANDASHMRAVTIAIIRVAIGCRNRIVCC